MLAGAPPAASSGLPLPYPAALGLANGLGAPATDTSSDVFSATANCTRFTPPNLFCPVTCT